MAWLVCSTPQSFLFIHDRGTFSNSEWHSSFDHFVVVLVRLAAHSSLVWHRIHAMCLYAWVCIVVREAAPAGTALLNLDSCSSEWTSAFSGVTSSDDMTMSRRRLCIIACALCTVGVIENEPSQRVGTTVTFRCLAKNES